ncbi:GL17098 [Drosophila persimilis]|uniref:GL17098 n=1 Tax=Drosophila persimilis TaxID=7234 RepID=B4GGP9_DROPE|nr:selenoprotein BthD [Drosophila persimilis]EDW35669.1 GL17098 [Drosophila persimilis]
MPKGKKKVKVVDWAADENFSKERSIFYVEHTTECPIFQMKAEECGAFFKQRIPEREFQLVRNKNGKEAPREGAFEIGFSQNARTSVHELWSGLTRGPPRRDKFPEDYENLVPDVQRVLKKFYPDKVVGLTDDEEDEN